MPSTLILTRLDKASCFMLVLAVVLILLTELKPLSHSAVVGEIVSNIAQIHKKIKYHLNLGKP